MAGTFQPQQNHILDALPQPERERLFPYLKLVALPLGKVLYESGDTLRHIYFPTDSIVSLLYVLKDGASAEIAVVGNDGAIGVALFMGGETTTNRAIVQSAGSAYMLTGARLKELGIIRYARGQITVLDRAQLEQLCCECYSVVKKETNRLLPAPPQP
jgi:CRP-like cAMP-binding protein